MRTFRTNIRPHVDAEISAAKEAEKSGQTAKAFFHLERAHVLGQASTAHHVRVHCHMFMWAVRNHRPREILGQTFRIVGAATKTAIGLVPTGNTGGSNVSPFKPMPIPSELAAKLQEAGSPQK